MPYPQKISNECLQDLLDEGFNQSEVARTCSITRQAVSSRIHFKPKKPAIQLRRWTVLFLRRLGFTLMEIANFTNYTDASVNRILWKNNFVTRAPSYWSKGVK